jgi:protein SFI1
VKHYRQAKIVDKFFVMKRAWRTWMVRAEECGREKRLKERDKGRAGKLFAGMSEVMLSARLHLEILWSVGWKEKALRQRRHRLAEQQIQSRTNTVGLSWDFDFDPLVLISLHYSQRVLKDALSHWTNRVIAVKLRELEVVQRRDKAIVL